MLKKDHFCYLRSSFIKVWEGVLDKLRVESFSIGPISLMCHIGPMSYTFFQLSVSELHQLTIEWVL